MKEQTDMFGEPHISIPDNPTLEKAANRILLMVQRDPTLLDGDTTGVVDRRIYAEVLWEDGLQQFIPSDKKDDFIHIVQKCTEADVLSRARRELLQRDLIRVSAKAVQSSERFRSRISKAMR